MEVRPVAVELFHTDITRSVGRSSQLLAKAPNELYSM